MHMLISSRAFRATARIGHGSRRRLFCSSLTADDHPIVDCRALLCGPSSSKAQTLLQIKEALQKRGYFYATGVDALPEEYIARVYDYLDAAHNLPLEIKQEFAQGGARGGSYSGADAGDEHAELDYEAGTKSSVCAWDYSRSGDYSAYPPQDLLHPTFETFVDNLYERQNALGAALMVAFAEMFGLPPDTFQQHFLSGDLGTIRLLNYPGGYDSSTVSERTSLSSFDHGISPHTDFEVFTLMHQDAPGLQLLPPTCTGDASQYRLPWIDAPVRPGEFVVIVGDVLERFTNGELKVLLTDISACTTSSALIRLLICVAGNVIVRPRPTEW